MTKRKIIPYNPKRKELARQLRKNMTLSEVLLWDQLKQKKMMDFDRQKPIDNFIVDFYCKREFDIRSFKKIIKTVFQSLWSGLCQAKGVGIPYLGTPTPFSYTYPHKKGSE